MSERAMPRADDQALETALRAAQAGDDEAFRLLYRDLQPRLLRYLRALVGAEAEDVAADAWLQIARDLGSFSGDYDRFRGWASTIARHRALDHLRRVGRRPDTSVRVEDLTDLVGRDDPERDALERLSTDSAIALICGLPRDQAEAVLLRVVVGLDAKEAGRVLGKRPGAVRTAAYRGLRRLSERLNTSVNDDSDGSPPPVEDRSDTPASGAGQAGEGRSRKVPREASQPGGAAGSRESAAGTQAVSDSATNSPASNPPNAASGDTARTRDGGSPASERQASKVRAHVPGVSTAPQTNRQGSGVSMQMRLPEGSSTGSAASNVDGCNGANPRGGADSHASVDASEGWQGPGGALADPMPRVDPSEVPKGPGRRWIDGWRRRSVRWGGAAGFPVDGTFLGSSRGRLGLVGPCFPGGAADASR
ncbi:RNA polymerase sigma factor [Actinomadura rugatobispora]|uniref:Sigma-70 family RNA polymerase sigma factor n=1 Tax=Actinomadura rugatobispora TaxID=1994 RepID=A0ABW1A4B2_9ACTN|nr:hypothetical protein GCM10010200_067650 [Actinomadura rugatobispora]